MEITASLGYWIRVVLVSVVALVAVVAALRRSRAKAAGRDLAVGVVVVLGAAGITVLTGPDVSYLLIGVALIAGVVVGFGVARVRLLVSLLLALSAVFMLIMGLFGEAKAYGIGVAVFAAGAGLQLGQGLRRTRKTPETPVGASVPSQPSPASPAAEAVPGEAVSVGAGEDA